jgi:hypothetical protein
MAQHFTRNTVSASAYCAKCATTTQHRVDDRRIGPCLECIARLDELYNKHHEFEQSLPQQEVIDWS